MPRSVEQLATEMGDLNEIVETVTLECSLSITRENVAAALNPAKPGGAVVLPNEHPLDAFALEDGAQGPIPDVVRFRDFVWRGGPNSWRKKPLQRFASLTKGQAKFILIDVDGGIHPYEIVDGELFECQVAIAFVRSADVEDGSWKLCKAGPLLRAGIAIGQRSADVAA